MTDVNQADSEFQDHLDMVADAILEGDVVPVLGAGANLCDRGAAEEWVFGTNLPSGAELSRWLAEKFDCKLVDLDDLVRVSQWADVTRGEGPLYKRLREVFVQDYPVPSLHEFLAGLPGWMKDNGREVRSQLIVSTNYDELMEIALRAKGVDFDLLRYVTNGEHRGKFVHRHPDGEEVVIERPNEYLAVDPDKRTVLLKIHGTIDRKDKRQDSYVITEDHYIEYLTRTNPSELIPAPVLAKMVNSAFLFLGYGMRDWNLRVILHRILDDRDLDWQSWAVQSHVDRLDEKIWRTRDVDLVESQLSDYIRQLRATLDGVVAP
ncbi:MAG: hypothetical protein QOE11_1229 [Solirubrobacteraceae bacterium]|jgi:hypothetical protein|nr:hypothetical protein [Solirubrobacteraceae bacterium]